MTPKRIIEDDEDYVLPEAAPPGGSTTPKARRSDRLHPPISPATKKVRLTEETQGVLSQESARSEESLEFKEAVLKHAAPKSRASSSTRTIKPLPTVQAEFSVQDEATIKRPYVDMAAIAILHLVPLHTLLLDRNALKDHICHRPRFCWLRALSDFYHSSKDPENRKASRTLQELFDSESAIHNLPGDETSESATQLALEHMLEGSIFCLPEELQKAFTGIVLRTSTCPGGCGYIGTKKSNFTCINLPDTAGSVTGCLNKHLFGPHVVTKEEWVCPKCNWSRTFFQNNRLLQMPRYLVLFVDTKANVAPPMAVPFYLDFLLHEEPDKLHPETKTAPGIAFLAGSISDSNFDGINEIYMRSGCDWFTWSFNDDYDFEHGEISEVKVLQTPPCVLIYSLVQDNAIIEECLAIKKQWEAAGFDWERGQLPAIQHFHSSGIEGSIPWPDVIAESLPPLSEDDPRRPIKDFDQTHLEPWNPARSSRPAPNCLKALPLPEDFVTFAFKREALRFDTMACTKSRFLEDLKKLDPSVRKLPDNEEWVKAHNTEMLKSVKEYGDRHNVPLEQWSAEKYEYFLDMDAFTSSHVVELFTIKDCKRQLGTMQKTCLQELRNKCWSDVKANQSLFNVIAFGGERAHEDILNFRFLLSYNNSEYGKFMVQDADSVWLSLLSTCIRLILWGSAHAEKWSYETSKKRGEDNVDLIRTNKPGLGIQTRIASLTPALLSLAVLLVELVLREETSFRPEMAPKHHSSVPNEEYTWFGLYDRWLDYFKSIWNHAAFKLARKALQEASFPNLNLLSERKTAGRSHDEDSLWSSFERKSLQDTLALMAKIAERQNR